MKNFAILCSAVVVLIIFFNWKSCKKQEDPDVIYNINTQSRYKMYFQNGEVYRLNSQNGFAEKYHQEAQYWKSM